LLVSQRLIIDARLQMRAEQMVAPAGLVDQRIHHTLLGKAIRAGAAIRPRTPAYGGLAFSKNPLALMHNRPLARYNHATILTYPGIRAYDARAKRIRFSQARYQRTPNRVVVQLLKHDGVKAGKLTAQMPRAYPLTIVEKWAHEDVVTEHIDLAGKTRYSEQRLRQRYN
jgi:hypothetical protein